MYTVGAKSRRTKGCYWVPAFAGMTKFRGGVAGNLNYGLHTQGLQKT